MKKEKMRIKVGISTCLLGQRVRFDGGHKHDRYITDILGEFFEFVPVCPEVAIGMGTPREAVRLQGEVSAPRLVGVKSGRDWTNRMNTYARKRVQLFVNQPISGYILKKDSPSCGMERVRVYGNTGMPTRHGRGLYAAELLKQLPFLPVEEEGRLNDVKLRENFIVRVFAYHRLQNLFNENYSRAELVRFHTVHKYLLLAHSPERYKKLGQLVADLKKYSPAQMREAYSRMFMETLAFKTTTSKNVNVLQHILGFLKKHLTALEKQDLLNVINEYHRQMVPLIVPVTLLKHYLNKYEIIYIRDQVYLNPHPKELMLRNHV